MSNDRFYVCWYVSQFLSDEEQYSKLFSRWCQPEVYKIIIIHSFFLMLAKKQKFIFQIKEMLEKHNLYSEFNGTILLKIKGTSLLVENFHFNLFQFKLFRPQLFSFHFLIFQFAIYWLSFSKNNLFHLSNISSIYSICLIFWTNR